MKAAIHITPGSRFGRWTVLWFHGTDDRRRLWFCSCDCGKTQKPIRGDHLLSGLSKSCGCYKKELLIQRMTLHGDKDSPEYRAWTHMLGRCFNPSDAAFPHYGGRGITVCIHWMLYENFLADMGRRPSPRHSLNRIDNDKSYYPSNCNWALPREQVNNRSITKKSNGVPFGDLARLHNIEYDRLDDRLRKGWSLHRALNTPVKKIRRT